MVVEIACTCEDLPAHSHVGQWVGGSGQRRYEDTGEVRIWVDWKALARELCRG